MMSTTKYIAVLCNYTLNPDRIGGMDRFFIAFDKKAKENGCHIDWFFSQGALFEFYENLSISLPRKEQRLEELFLEQLSTSSKKYTIVITHFMELTGVFYKKIKLLLPMSKSVVVDHNPRPLEGFSLKKKSKKRLSALLYSKYIDVFIGVSRYTAQHIIKDLGSHVKDKVITIYNGIDVNHIECAENQSHKEYTAEKPLRLIVVSHLRKSKGIQDAIVAVSKLSPVLKRKLIIDIYGEGPLEGYLKTLVNDNNLQDIITFKGSSPRISSILYKYAYLLQPTYMECFSLSILESLAANVPVITTTVGGNTEIITHNKNGYLFNPKDVFALQQLLERLLTGEIEITTKTRETIEQHYTLARMVDQHFKLVTS